MRKQIGAVMLLLLLCGSTCDAQVWELHVAAGASYGKLLPSKGSTERSSIIKYRFNKSGVYFSPELNFRISTASAFSLGYQFSSFNVGVYFYPDGLRGPKNYSLDGIMLHTISVGYSFRSPVLQNQFLLGGYAKVGLGYGSLYQIGEGSSSGKVDIGAYDINTRRTTEFEVMENFWSPTASAGISVTPRAKGRRIADRLSFTGGFSVVLKDPYQKYSETEYNIATRYYSEHGVARFKGKPLMLQFGLDYNLFHSKERMAFD